MTYDFGFCKCSSRHRRQQKQQKRLRRDARRHPECRILRAEGGWLGSEGEEQRRRREAEEKLQRCAVQIGNKPKRR